ncbi:MAG: rRNA adenine dimethyltransferase family protein, partial [Candidatus Micrarchaeaceae archaeon]
MAAYGKGRKVIEIGAGTGILTQQLAQQADKVLAIEFDKELCNELKKLSYPNLHIICNDFFSVKETEFEDFDIVIANIPYNLSSKILFWLLLHDLEAVLCVQKEFAEHMLAKPSDKKYSKLSVFSQLSFFIEKVLNIPASCFSPMPSV